MSELGLNCQSVSGMLTDFLRTEVTRAGFQRAVIGLSGGLDSSTAAVLAVKALGPDNVTGYMLPYKTSSEASIADARLVVERLGIESVTVDITPMVDAYLDTVPDAGPLRAGNVMARQRMIVLYDRSAQQHALVLGTANKTEYILGYTTLWGDMACALTPIGDLYKTQVRQLARYLGVPERIIKKPPSADLWTGQTDEGELGFTYETVDRLLWHLIDRRCTMRELEGLGYRQEFVHNVCDIIRQTRFKRRMPLVAMVLSGTVEPDAVYPRDPDN